MTQVFAILGRLTIMLLAYAAACVAASAFLHLVWIAPLGIGLTGGADPVFDGTFYFTVPFMALFIAYFAFFQALVVVVIAEWWGKRDWLFYAVAGAAVTLPIVGVLLTAHAGSELREPGFLLTIVGAGMVGGLAYWLAAGRDAGRWRRTVPTAPERSGS